MSQFVHEMEPGAEVTFSFKNRGEQRLLDYVDIDDLKARFDRIIETGFNQSELDYLSGLTNSAGESVFSDNYLEHLKTSALPPVKINIEDDDIAIQTTGEWSLVTFWETIIMSELNEAYFEGIVAQHGLDIFEVYNEGERRLSEKIAILQANPDIKIADFGTRRHFSHRWQAYVVERLINECPDNFLGTSNVALAQKYGVKPIGTFAHELPMAYGGLAEQRLGLENVIHSHNQLLDDWYNFYGQDLSIALTDTFTTDFFFADFTPEQAKNWRGLRQDSGDPIEFGEKAIGFYKANNIDPTTKTIVFSDGLDIDEIVRLNEHFKDRVNVVFGWGTTLTNDLGLKPLNIVMKATEVNGTSTVKLSDNPGKHTGPADKVAQYQTIFKVKENDHELHFATI